MSEQTPAHFLTWTHDQDCVRVSATCAADEGADCRLICADPDCYAEEFSVDRRLDGTPFHVAGEDNDGDEIFHDLKDAGWCNVCEFLNEGGCIEEEAVDTPSFVIGTVPIEPVWQGDYYAWKRAEADGPDA